MNSQTTMDTQCPVCLGDVTIPAGSEISEIITCPDCSSRLVVMNLTATEATLEQAPEVEEDWGE